MGQKPRAVLLGAGGHGKVVLDALLAAERYELVGVVDDDTRKAGLKLLGVPVLGPPGDFSGLAAHFGIEGVVVAIGDNYIREEKIRALRAAGLRPLGVVHPRAHISPNVKLGEGVVILAGAVVNAGTVIEDNVCINTSASVDHDNHLGRSCHVFPNATLTGGVRLGEFVYVGSGAVVNPYLTIGAHSYVGAGAVVIEDVPEGLTVVGVPARGISRRQPAPHYAKVNKP